VPNDQALAALLHPHTPAEFFADVFEQRALHVRAAENPALTDLCDTLLTLEDVDHLLTTVYAAEPRRLDSIRMGREGVLIAPDEYLVNQIGPLAEVDVERVLALHRNGASIILNSVNATVEPVAELCRGLSDAIGVGVHANLYVTPTEAQGFPLHFDPHDVFLLQTYGEKVWTTYPSPVPLATAEARGAEDLEPQGPATRLTLRRGELLYIPRGLLHEGVTESDVSVHLTLGLEPYTWSQLLHDVVKELEADDVELRRSPPRRDGAVDGFDAALAGVVERLSARALANRAAVEAPAGGRSFLPHRGLLLQIHKPERVDLATAVRLHDQASPELHTDGEDLTLTFGGSVLTLPAFTEPHVATLCAGVPVRGADLPNSLDDDGKLVLVRRLVREGLLVPA
jgi:hypothetical protein